MFSALLVAIGIGGAVYLGWHGADSSVVFLLALAVYFPAAISDKNKIITALTNVRMRKSPVAALMFIIHAIIVPYGSGLIAVSIFFFVSMWVKG